MIEERKQELEIKQQARPRLEELPVETPVFFTEAEELPFHIPRD